MDAVFLKLLNMSITASWMILAVILLRLLLKKAPKSIRCILWALVAVRLVCPFSLESMFSLIPSTETVPRDIVYSASPAITSGISVLNSTINPIISDTLAPKIEYRANPIHIITTVATIVWIAGMAIMLMYAVFSYMKLRRKVSAAMLLRDNLWLCDEVRSPFILGFLKPRIFIPSDLDEVKLNYIVAHELEHLKRFDHWWKSIGFLLLGIHWINPLIWLAYALLCRDIELTCDERVVKEKGTEEKKAYSEVLLWYSMPHRGVSACPLAFGEVGVKERIKNILSYKKPSLWMIAIAGIASIVVMVCFLTNPKSEQKPVHATSALDTNDITPSGIELIAGECYLSSACIYMNPLSSYLAIGGDSGRRYLIGEDSFTIADRRSDYKQTIAPVIWEWKDFPWTDEEWEALFIGGGGLSNISKRHDVMQYQLLDERYALLNMDGQLWLIEILANSQVKQQLWSIYSLVPEIALGSAQWEFIPALSSQYPAFRFQFDLPYTEINAVCVDGGELIGYDDYDGRSYPQGVSLNVPPGSALYWSPMGESSTSALNSTISFTIQNKKTTTYAGTIYITGEVKGDRNLYTASIVGSGLYLAQAEEEYGAVITATNFNPTPAINKE